MLKLSTRAFALYLAVCCAGSQVNAQISLPEGLEIKPSLDLSYALFHSDKSYNRPDAKNAVGWQEAYAKYGVHGQYSVNDALFSASLVGVSSATFGDGDAAGFSTGKERKTSVDEWTLGWKNRKQDPSIDLSLGRQKVVIGDGFIVAGDALNIGRGIADGEMDRGGGYYLAARQSFDFTTVAHVQLTDQFSTHWYYLKSNNKAQYQPTLWSTDWQYQYAKSNFALMYLQVGDLKDPLHESVRQDLKDISVRANTQLTEQWRWSGEYVHQKQKENNANAWYISTQYRFDQLHYQPTLAYRYSSFSEDYDPLFYGNTDAGFGTWFQGEVAGNYAGPMSSNARIQQLSLQASFSENVTVGLLAYQFNTLKKKSSNLNGREWDIFAIWTPTQQINVIPLIGFYKPKQDIDHLGSQVGDNRTNTYTQLILQYLY